MIKRMLVVLHSVSLLFRGPARTGAKVTSLLKLLGAPVSLPDGTLSQQSTSRHRLPRSPNDQVNEGSRSRNDLMYNKQSEEPRLQVPAQMDRNQELQQLLILDGQG